MKYNEDFMEGIQAAKTSRKLLRIWQEMAEGSFLNWYVNPAMPKEAIKDFEGLGKKTPTVPDGTPPLNLLDLGEAGRGLEKPKKLLADLPDNK